MSDKSFSESVAFVMGTRAEVLGVFCPRCAFDRMRAVVPLAQEITYLETVATAGAHVRCASCEAFPLVLQAQEHFRAGDLLDFMGRVMKMAARIEMESTR